MEEYWDVYDQNRIFQNKTIKRGDAFSEGEYYVACEVWFLNSKGELLTTQRHPDKKAGGLWEFVGGGVLAGETTLQAAVRETREEIGISILPQELTLIYVYQRKNYFMDIYLLKKDFEISELVLDKNETVAAKWVSRKQLETMIEDKKTVFSVAQRYNTLKNEL